MVTTPEPGGTPGTPVTEDGNRYPTTAAALALEAFLDHATPEDIGWADIPGELAAIEAEAARSERELIVAAVEGLPWAAMVPEPSLSLVRAAVLALIDVDRRP